MYNKRMLFLVLLRPSVGWDMKQIYNISQGYMYRGKLGTSRGVLNKEPVYSDPFVDKR
jgi:hypothetical protein